MRCRRLDTNHDFMFGQGRNDYLVDIDAVGQVIETRLRLFLNEWWEDKADGLPMWQSFLGASGAKNHVRDRLLQERILGTQGVTGIESLLSVFDPITNSYEVQVIVNTIYGQVALANQGAYNNFI